MALLAGSAYSEYRLKLDPFYADIRAAEAALRQFQGRVEGIKPPTVGGDPQSARAAADLAKANAQIAQAQARATAAQQQAEQQALRTAAAQQRLAQASQQTAAAEARAAAAVSQSAAAAARAEQAQLRLAQAKDRAEAASRRSASSLGGVVQALGGISLGAGGAIAALGTAAAAMDQAAQRAQIIQRALGELSPDELQRVDAAASTLAARFGLDLTKQVDAARVVMKAFETDALGAYDIIAAGAARGINVSDDFLDTLQEYAPQFAALGFNAEQTLSLLATGLANGARNTDVIGDAFKELNILLNEAATVGKLEPLNAGLAETVRQFQAGQISGDEAFTAIIAGLNAMGDTVARQEAGVALFGTKFEDLGATAVLSLGQANEALISTEGAVTNLNNRITSLGELIPRAFAGIGAALAPVNDFLVDVANNVLQVTSAGDQVDALQARILAGADSFDAYRESTAAANEQLMAIGQTFAPLTEAQFTYAQALIAGGTATAEALAQAQTYGQELTILDDGTSQVTESSFALADAQALLADAQAQAAAAAAGNTDSSLSQAEAQRAAALAAQEDALQQLLLAAQSDETAAAKERLRAQAQGAAQALLASGADGAAAAAQLANSSNLIDQLTSAYYRLAAGKAAAGEAEAALQAQRAGERDLNRDPRRTAEQEEMEARRRRMEQEQARRTAQAIGGRGRSGGGGGGRSASGGGSAAATAAEREAKRVLDAQQRIDEQRVSLAQETAERLAALEQESAERRLQIQLDFHRKQLQAERDLRVDSLNSRADFYDALTSSEVPDAVAQQLSAAYEQAFAEAQKFAQEGKAELAARYLELKQEQIQAELRFQEEVAAARASGDQEEVQRLQAIQELRRKAQEEELKQLVEGGDQNVNARDQALASEAERYGEQTAKLLGASAEKAAKLNADEAAIRQGIEQTNVALAEQIRLQREAGGLPAVAPPVTPPPPPPTAPTLPVAQAAAQQAALPLPGAEGGMVAVNDAQLLAVVQQLPGLLANMQAILTRIGGSGEATVAGLAGTQELQAQTVRAVQSLGRRNLAQ